MLEPEPRYEVYLYVADENDDACFKTNHRFVERPDIETVRALFDEAKRDFTELYPLVEATEFSVEVEYLRPRDVAPQSSSQGDLKS
jgi:hypothetical protein